MSAAIISFTPASFGDIADRPLLRADLAEGHIKRESATCVLNLPVWNRSQRLGHLIPFWQITEQRRVGWV
jgi:hypothetical protein